MSSKKETNLKSWFSPAVTVIIIFGVISMLGDIVYESARSANSQYLNLLGISAAKVGLVFGIGEFLGYALRLFAGVMSDKSGRHWIFMFIGYGMLISVPLMDHDELEPACNIDADGAYRKALEIPPKIRFCRVSRKIRWVSALLRTSGGFGSAGRIFRTAGLYRRFLLCRQKRNRRISDGI